MSIAARSAQGQAAPLREVTLLVICALWPVGVTGWIGCTDGEAMATGPRGRPPSEKGQKGKKPASDPTKEPHAFVLAEMDKLGCPPPGVKPGEAEIMLPPPPFSEGSFPCADCHKDMEHKPRRELTDAHTEIKLNHGPREGWCYDCHSPTDRDKLRLASGALVDFKESYKLCGQCHGPKLRDWRLGLHGRRYGEWRGQRPGQRCNLLCAHCHDPHSPRFKSVKPLPPPERPGHIR